MKKCLAYAYSLSALLALAPAAAFADPSKPHDFSGKHFTLSVGGTASDTKVTDITGEEFGEFAVRTPGGVQSLNGNGSYFGVALGYNVQSGALIYGGELELGRLDINDLVVRNGDDGIYTKMSNFIALTARLGYAKDRTLFYAKAGPAWAKIRNAGGEFEGFGEEQSDGYWGFDGDEAGFGEGIRNGYLLGLGFEHVLPSGLSFVAEYNYADFGAVTLGHVDGNMSEPFAFENELHLVKLGLSYRF
ncbi:outer membrane beta-barrel protein [Xinfangfangia sp. CPCC 101601]|uniref:Outer membrane beta-barrel protein n=1 Tax=Pseudogemmobacter lacusdianii TaxID=3069608 RepID=A0ABU0W119_9RHOB|nr:outer membrane beta-barrel protein [Xinfangfangia sp. CPCC 101601]MDQ2067711.1 outer membrane beta-barrel protein [Xinfangfangia sp. CPCC 101601]